MRKYHHIGIPTDIPRENETYLEKYKMYISGFKESPYGVEWMRFEPDSPLPELVKSIPHVAFEVDDLEAEIQGKEILIMPNSPSKGITVAFIVDNGTPIEFIKVEKITE
ncbi:MAG: VOC family protein [Candidatus Aminicenantes bacterium]|nr:MAG: VOC family protein [Candidatus Aminicenantes bacterium]